MQIAANAAAHINNTYTYTYTYTSEILPKTDPPLKKENLIYLHRNIRI